jgi:membrane-associated phospholipid phosphatase
MPLLAGFCSLHFIEHCCKGSSLQPSWLHCHGSCGSFACRLGVLAAGGDVAADARRSYPSGHCAYVFATATVVTLYLLGKFRVFSKPGKVSQTIVLW